MTPPVSNKPFELVVIQNPEGNPHAIDVGERIAVVGEGGHLPPEKAASALAALGIHQIPVGTKIRPLKNYVQAMQRAFAMNARRDPLSFQEELRVAQLMATRSGIKVDPVALPSLKKNYAEACQSLLPIVKEELERGEYREAFQHVGWADFFGKKGEFYPRELELLIECITELRTAAGFYEQGYAGLPHKHLEMAQAKAEELSISIDKSIEWVEQFNPYRQKVKMTTK